ncbi:MAG: radical SAM protein, partial [Pseudomonadota bacterium]
MTATAPSASPPALGAAATAPATAPARFDDLLFPWPPQGAPAAAPLRAALERQGRFGAGQLAGRLFPIACVALEVTQRCNLDCSLCYLSDLAEATPDIPLD